MTLPTEIYYIVGILGLIAVLVIFVIGKRSSHHSPFETRPLLNKTEARVLKTLSDVLPNDWMIMCQVSYGAFLKNKDFATYRKVNSKRADFIAVGKDLTVKAVIEYQGSGHFGRSTESRKRANESDRIKRLATSQAGLIFIEIPAKFSRETLSSQFIESGISFETGPNKGADNEHR